MYKEMNVQFNKSLLQIIVFIYVTLSSDVYMKESSEVVGRTLRGCFKITYIRCGFAKAQSQPLI